MVRGKDLGIRKIHKKMQSGHALVYNVVCEIILFFLIESHKLSANFPEPFTNFIIKGIRVWLLDLAVDHKLSRDSLHLLTHCTVDGSLGSLQWSLTSKSTCYIYQDVLHKGGKT